MQEGDVLMARTQLRVENRENLISHHMYTLDSIASSLRLDEGHWSIHLIHPWPSLETQGCVISHFFHPKTPYSSHPPSPLTACIWAISLYYPHDEGHWGKGHLCSCHRCYARQRRQRHRYPEVYECLVTEHAEGTWHPQSRDEQKRFASLPAARSNGWPDTGQQ